MHGHANARLRRPLERTIAHGHPWIWRDSLDGLTGVAGTVITVLDRQRRFLARGLEDSGPIGVRVLTLRDEPVDAALFEQRAAVAALLRQDLRAADCTAFRWIHGEGDLFAGVVVDLYDGWGVLELDGAAAPAWREVIVAALTAQADRVGLRGLVERLGHRRNPSRADAAEAASPAQTRARASGGDTTEGVEGLGDDASTRRRACVHRWGAHPPETVEIREHGMILPVDLRHGQKTGLFLDHRESRRRVRELARGRRVLNLFSYTGGFSIAAGLGGATSVTSVDQSAPALDFGARGWARNGLPEDRHTSVRADVLRWLPMQVEQQRWDLVICDPPSFAPNEATRSRALSAYRRLHGAAIRAVERGGLLLAASCSSHVDLTAFSTTLAEAAHSERATLQILATWGADVDHPVPIGFPEGRYLDAVLCRRT